MVIAALIVLGLACGSFVNALVWRLHEQAHETAKKKASKKYLKELSIMRGRSMCPHCKHVLTTSDLIPVFSWLWLRGKCRYCKAPISAQYPLVELLTAALFVVSYIYWPLALQGRGLLEFVFWLIFVTGFVALTVYDLKWFLLPDRIVYPLIGLSLLQILLVFGLYLPNSAYLVSRLLGMVVGGGIFYALFQLSQGRWIGGGDVKLGALIGLIVGGPAASFLVLFIASVCGTLVSLPLLAASRLKKNSQIPFGPFLILAAIIVQLFGAGIIAWMKRNYLLPS